MNFDFLNRFFGNDNTSTSKAKRQRGRSLRMEQLEPREMLSVSTTEFAQIKSQYADLNLSANMADYNVIEITAAQLSSDTALRSAITTAANTTQNDLIVVRTTASQNKITLSGSELAINMSSSARGSLTIVSLGTSNLTIDANQQSRVLSVSSSSVVALAGLTITGGKTAEFDWDWDGNDDDLYGGGIYNDSGTLTVTNCTISGNAAGGNGGGISSYAGTLTVTNSIISGNSVNSPYGNGYGGGIIIRDGTLTVINCTISGNSVTGYGYGGGIVNDDGTLTVTNCTISGNSATYAGGGIYSQGTLTVTNCTIFGNSTGYSYNSGGGGIYSQGTLTVTNCTISGNSTSGATGFNLGGGGGIYSEDGTLTVTNCTISGNSTDNGGGIYSRYSTVAVTDCTISGNSATTIGGGIDNANGTLTVINCTISGNEAAFSGGGMYNWGSTVAVTNSTISGNSGGNGGGICTYGYGMFTTVTGCTIAHNSASTGGGMYNWGSTWAVTNCEIFGNSAYYGGGIASDGTLTVTNCTIVGNSANGSSDGGGIRSRGTTSFYNTIIVQNIGGDIVHSPEGTLVGFNNLTTFTDWNSGSENIFYDPDLPLFMDAENGDYRLAPSLQAIDKGNNEYAYNAGLDESSLDMAGQLRIVGGAIDIGAYESYVAFSTSQFSVYRGAVTFQWNMAEDAETMRLTWVSGTTTTVLGTFTAEGSYTWDTTQHPDAPGILKVEYLDERNRIVAYAEFVATIINDPAIVIHRGKITTGETWVDDKVHLVVDKLDLAAGAAITVTENAVVKFWKNSYINTASGSTVIVQNNAVFTRAEDDSIGGDTNKDDNNSVPRDGNAYVRGMGTFTLSPSATQKFLLQTRSGTISANETWSFGQVIHVTGTITVATGATLTIEPGAIIKFDPNCSLIVSFGATLIAEGTAAQPIIFTSIRDDAHGGDTNEDDDWTRPQAGDWHQIRANGGTIIMNYTRVAYCSNVADQGGLYVVGGSITFNNSIIEFTKYDSLLCSSGTFSANNSIIRETSVAVGYYSGSGTTLINCVIDNATVGVRGSGKTFINTVFSNIKTTFSESSGGTFQNCVFWNPKGYGPQSFAQAGSNGNFWADPMFRDAANGDYRLRPGSPLIDAADSTKAPATDITGAPRVSDDNITNKKGTPYANGNYADIGAYEFIDNAQSDIDLEPIDLQAASTAMTGEKVTLQWTVRNNGSAPAMGTWTDQIVMVSDAGQVVTVADITHSGNIIGGDLQTFYAEVTVPNVSVGNWRFAVLVNVNRNIFEGANNDNNRIDAVAWTNIDVPLLTERKFDVNITKNTPQLYRIEIPAGQAFSLSASSGNAVSILLAEGRAPTATSFDYIAASDDKGNYALSVPASATARTFYLLVSTERSTANVSVDISDKTLGVISVAQSSVSNAGASTIGFIGAGFDNTMTVALKLGSTTINATSVNVSSGADASARFDLTGRAAGVYDLVITKGGATVTLANAVTVTTSSVGARLEATLDIVDAVRVGRIYQGWIVFENTGDCDILLPVFTVSSSTNTPIGLTSDTVSAGNTIYLLAAGSSGSAGVLRPGETGRVEFYFEGTNNTRINFSTWAYDNTTTPFFTSEHWTNWVDFKQDLSDAMTRLEQRGYMPKDYNELVSFVTAQKSGENTTGLSGQLRNAQTGEAIAGASIVAEWTSSGETQYATATTDANGHYVFNYLPASATVALSLLDTAYDLSASTVHISGSKDVSGFNMTALPFGSVAGRVTLANGSGAEGVVVIAESLTGEFAAALTDHLGHYRFDSLVLGTWNITILVSGQYHTLSSETVTVNSASQTPRVNFTLSATGSISGQVLNKSNSPLADVLVRVANDVDEWVATAVTDESGNYLIENIPVGTYRIFAVSETLAWQQQEIIVKSNETVSTDLVAASSSLTGRVFVSGSTPATAGNVFIYNVNKTDDPVFEFVLLSAEIGADGSYQFDSLLSGEYLIEVHTESGTAFASVTIGGVSNTLNITLPAQTDFSGKVNFASSIPAGEIILVAIVSGDESVQILVDTDEDGNFIVGKIPQGNYHITVVSADGILAEQDVVLNAASQTAEINSSHVFPARLQMMSASNATPMVGVTSLAASGILLETYNQIIDFYKNIPLTSQIDSPPTLCAHSNCQTNAINAQISHESLIYEETYRKFAEQLGKDISAINTAIIEMDSLTRQMDSIGNTFARDAAVTVVLSPIKKVGSLVASAYSLVTEIGGLIRQLTTGNVNLYDTSWSIAQIGGRSGVLLLEAGARIAKSGEAIAKNLAKSFGVAFDALNAVKAIDEVVKLMTIRESHNKVLSQSTQQALHAINQIDDLIKKIEANNARYETSCNCDECCEDLPEDEPKDDERPGTPQSCDPNELWGPIGHDFEIEEVGTEEDPFFVIVTPNWITDDRDQTITVFFENKSSATAAAQEVFVSMQMPSEWDWNTLVMTNVCIGDQVYTQMAGWEGTNNEGTWFLQQESTGEQIQLYVSFDAETGLADWYLRSYVSTTFDNFPASAYDGFLLPNDETGRGEGYITFGIRMKGDLDTGTRVESYASIIFDLSDPIVTNTWVNTIDATPPTSSVTPFSSQNVSTNFTVRWSGTDVGSGINCYDIYVSVDGGAFVKWLDKVSFDYAVYNGEVGHTYSFYSVAYDNVGLVETGTKSAEATVTVTTSSEPGWPTILSSTHADGKVTITWTNLGSDYRYLVYKNGALVVNFGRDAFYVDTSPSSTNTYYVYAFNDVEERWTWATPVVVTTTAPVIAITAHEVLPDGKIKLSWSGNANVTIYAVYNCGYQISSNLYPNSMGLLEWTDPNPIAENQYQIYAFYTDSEGVGRWTWSNLYFAQKPVPQLAAASSSLDAFWSEYGLNGIEDELFLGV